MDPSVLALPSLHTPALPGILKPCAVMVMQKWLEEADVITGEGPVTLFTLPCYEGMLTVNKPRGDGFLQAGTFEREKMAVSLLEGPQFIMDSMQQPHLLHNAPTLKYDDFVKTWWDIQTAHALGTWVLSLTLQSAL